jgi:hypothetical protein
MKPSKYCKMKFRLTSKKMSGSMLFEYDSNGVLMAFENGAELTADQMKWIAPHFPITKAYLDAMTKASDFKAAAVPPKLDFDILWDAYGYKIGKKDVAKRLWSMLTDVEKAAVLASISKYNYYLSQRTTAKAYLETYLRNRRWENEY